MTTQPIRNKKQIHRISIYFLTKHEYRNHLLFVAGVHTALRISDMLRLTWDDVYDFTNHRVKPSFSITEKKTGKNKIVAINHALTESISRLFKHLQPKSADFLFANSNTHKSISRIQAYRVIRAAAEECETEIPVSCHSLRKTFGYHLWKSGTPLVVIMDIYNHSSYAVTKRYLGITQDDKNSAYLSLNLGA
jgi:integrase